MKCDYTSLFFLFAVKSFHYYHELAPRLVALEVGQDFFECAAHGFLVHFRYFARNRGTPAAA